MNWDNLRFFLELARAGTLTTAARRLDVEHTTVARRVQAFETSAGVPLFLRTAQGYVLTEHGRALLPTAEAMEQAYARVELALPSAAEAVAGTVRIGCNEAYGTTILPRHVAGIVRDHPDLRVDVLALPRAIHLPRNEADIIITIERPERGPYVVVKLADYVLRLYASDEYLRARPAIANIDALRGHAFISYIEDLAFAKNVPTPRAITQPGYTAIRSTSILSQMTAAAAGAGIAILPAWLGQGDPRLRAVLPHEVQFMRTYWMMMPVELKGVARVRRTWDALRRAAAQERALLNPAP